MKVTEPLSLAGSLKHMCYAFAYGADAVYAGQWITGFLSVCKNK